MGNYWFLGVLFGCLSNSAINEEAEGEEEEDEDDEKAMSRSRSNPHLEEAEPEIDSELAEVKTGNSVPSDSASKHVEQVGYNLLDHHGDDADLEPETSSSCSSDLSFGQSSSGMIHNFNSTSIDYSSKKKK